MRKFSFVFIVIALIGFAISCATSPTGRKQLILLPSSQLNQMGVDSFAEMKQKQPIETNAAINQYVKCIAYAVATEVSPANNWEVVVFQDNTANAFALPGGKIGVHTGMLKVAKNQEQLAAVLGHEVGHVIAKHGNERVSQTLLAQGGLAALDGALKKSTTKSVLMAGLGLGAQFGVLMPFGRTQESEADQIGQDLMAQAGFDPRQSVELWKNMASSGGSQPPEWLSTHPSHSSRIEHLQSRMSHAVGIYNRAQASGKKPYCQRPSSLN